LTHILAHPISSRALKAIIATYSITTLLLAWYLIFIAKATEDAVDDDRIGASIIWHFLEGCLGLIWRYFLLIPLTLLQYLPQILTTLALHTRGSISLVSLGLQIIVFVVLGICQGLRLGVLVRANPLPDRTWNHFYFQVGYMWMNYFGAVLGQIALFIACIYVDRNKLGAGGQLRL
jgi:hypothetical protein